MKIGFVVDNLIYSEGAYKLIREINESKGKGFRDICIFASNISAKVQDPQCAVLEAQAMWNFQGGALVATDLQSAKTLKNVPTTAKKFLYLWDIDWMSQPYNFAGVVSTLADPEITLLSSSPNYNLITRNLCGIEVPEERVIEDYNLEKFYEVCN